jgi:conjugative transfer ATPase
MFGFMKLKGKGLGNPVTLKDVTRLGMPPPSFVDHLPWMGYNSETQLFEFPDGVSKAAMIELSPIATEGKDETFMATARKAICNAIAAIDEHDTAEWVVQTFVNDDVSVKHVVDELEAYIAPEIRETVYTQNYLSDMRRHIGIISRKEGIFVDGLSGNRFRSQQRRTRVVIYRRYPKGYDFSNDRSNPSDQVKEITSRFIENMRQSGLRASRYSYNDFYEWMLPFFNANTPSCASPEELLARAPCPDLDLADAPFGVDLASTLFLAEPKSDVDTGTWWFQDRPYSALTIQSLLEPPKIGHLTAERTFGDGKKYALWDNMPEGTMLSLTTVIRAQDLVKAHITRIIGSSGGDGADAVLAKENCERTLERMANGDKLLPMYGVIYVRGDNLVDLQTKTNQVTSTFENQQIRLIERRHDLTPLDAFIAGLPMAFDPQVDQKTFKRSRLTFLSQIAALLPIYGRNRGTGNPGITFLNRAGEQLSVDPLKSKGSSDRKKNAHMGIFGPTGAGKSATSVNILRQQLAVYRPRIFAVDAGNSFGLFLEDCKAQGLSTNYVNLNPDSDVSLPPFADAYKALEQQRQIDAVTDDVDDDVVDREELNDRDAKRDILGEMEIAARVMITGGEDKEAAKMSRADRTLIRRGIMKAATTGKETNLPMIITENVADALASFYHDESIPEVQRNRAYEMSEAMRMFCTGQPGKFFNRQGQSWPDADVTVIELGLLAREGYEDQLTVAYLAAMNHVNAIAEAKQYESRPTIMFTDEAHIPFKNPLLAPYAVKITKMWRKLGTWFWFATQNVADLPDEASKILKMLEWWILLTMGRGDLNDLMRFVDITPERQAVILSARKEPGKYTEGVLFTDTIECLFRSVPPSITLALAMTEKEEKSERAAIMRELHCTELQAAYEVAKRLDARRSAPILTDVSSKRPSIKRAA